MSWPEFVMVEWTDAWADSGDDVYVIDVHTKHKPMQMQTLGWLLADDEAGVSLFNEHCVTEDSYRSRTFIPRAMVTNVIPYRLVKPRGKRK